MLVSELLIKKTRSHGTPTAMPTVMPTVTSSCQRPCRRQRPRLECDSIQPCLDHMGKFPAQPALRHWPRIAPRSHEEIQRFTGHSIVPLCRTKRPGCLEYVSAHRFGIRAVRYPYHSLFSDTQLFRSTANRHRRLGAQNDQRSLSCDHFTSINAPRKLHFEWLSFLCVRLPFRLETIQESQRNKMITRQEKLDDQTMK